jgi:hypothetical protein
MHTSNQMRFAMAIHMLQKSNPAARTESDNSRGAARRHLGRAQPSADRRLTTQNAQDG